MYTCREIVTTNKLTSNAASTLMLSVMYVYMYTIVHYCKTL